MDTDAVLDLLREVAARVIDPRFGALARDEVRSKRRPGDLVTVADREAEVAITRVLRSAYPEALMVGEEAVAADASLLARLAGAEHAFVVDPLDGTRHFVRGSPDHAVMVAETRDDVVVRSWIWQPRHARSYVAELGAGAWSGSRRLSVPPRARRGLVRVSGTCCGVDYPRLAEGEADLALYLKTKPWDHLPGRLVLTEAGGTVRRRGPLLVASGH